MAISPPAAVAFEHRPTGAQAVVDTPTVSVLGPEHVRVGHFGTFDATVKGAVNPTYTWVSKRGWIVGPENDHWVKVEPPAGATGSDTVTVTAQSARGGTAVVSRTYFATIESKVNLYGPTSAEMGSRVIFSGDASGTGIMFDWSVQEDACSITLGGHLTCGDYTGPATVTLTASSPGSTSTSASHTVVFYDPDASPVLSIERPDVSPAGGSSTFTVKNTGSPVNGWSWAAPSDCLEGPADAQQVVVRCPFHVLDPIALIVTGRTAQGSTHVAHATFAPTPGIVRMQVDAPASVDEGETVSVIGQATQGSADEGVKGRMRLEMSSDGSTWTTLAGPILRSDGRITATHRPTARTVYRVVLEGHGPTAARVLQIARQATQIINKRTVRAERVKVVGVLRNSSGKPLARRTLVLQRKVARHKWRQVRVVRTNAHGKAVVKRIKRIERRHQFRWVHDTTTKTLGSTSPLVTVRAR